MLKDCIHVYLLPNLMNFEYKMKKFEVTKGTIVYD